jgi:hypothetical protein
MMRKNKPVGEGTGLGAERNMAPADCGQSFSTDTSQRVDPARRLRLFVLPILPLCFIVACSKGQEVHDRWELHDDVSKMDGAHNTRVTREAEEKLHFGQHSYSPWLTLQLDPSFELVVHTVASPAYNVWNKHVAIRYRLDDQPPVMVEALLREGPIGSGGAAFPVVPAKLFAANKMLVEYTDNNKAQRTLTFDLSGLYKGVQRACMTLRPGLDCNDKSKNIQAYLDAAPAR